METFSLRGLARPAVHAVRSVPAWGRAHILRYGEGPLAVFLPAYGRHGAARLRIYNVASELRRQGWRTLVVPWNLPLISRSRLLARTDPDVIVMQGSRHHLNRPELYPDFPIFYDLDDADFHLDHLKGPVHRAMPKVTAVIAGSAYIADWCLRAGAPQVHVVWTGSPPSDRSWRHHRDRKPVVAWAQTRPMTYVHEAGLVRDLVAQVGQRHPITLRLYDRRKGDEPGFADSFQAEGVSVEWVRSCTYNRYLESFDDVSLGLAPLCPESPFSRGKSFGKALAYLDARVPVIGSDACEHGNFFDSKTGVISNEPNHWCQAAVSLLQDASARQSMADRAFERFKTDLSVASSARRLDDIMRGYLKRR